eukprot:289706-Prymnesium_polylepis.1
MVAVEPALCSCTVTLLVPQNLACRNTIVGDVWSTYFPSPGTGGGGRAGPTWSRPSLLVAWATRP